MKVERQMQLASQQMNESQHWPTVLGMKAHVPLHRNHHEKQWRKEPFSSPSALISEKLFSPWFASSPFCFVTSIISGSVYSWIIDTSPALLGPILTRFQWIWAQHSHTAASANPGVQDCLMQSLPCPSPMLSMAQGKACLWDMGMKRGRGW